MEFAANATTLFILKFEELGGEIVDGAFGVFHFGDIGEGADDTNEIAMRIELRDSTTKNPHRFVGTGKTESDQSIMDGCVGAKYIGDGVILGGEGLAVLGDRNDAKVGGKLADSGAFRDVEDAISGTVGKLDGGVRGVKNDAEMEVADERTETLFARTENVFGFFAFGNIANDDETTVAIAEFNDGSAHLADADQTGFGAEAKFEVADMLGAHEGGEDLVSTLRIDPEIHLAWSPAKGFFARVAGETGEAVVDFEIGTIRERVDAESIGAIAKGGGEDLLGAAERAFGGEEVIGDATLTTIREDEANGGTENGGGNREPSKEQLLAGNGAAHEDNEKWDSDG